MDNTKTGFLIKKLRKEKGMTQKELADFLHITDRAVSKWERGLCAPDISLLEPLAEILGISIAELIEGKRDIQDDYIEKVVMTAKNIIDYSREEITRKVKILNRTHIIIAMVCFVAIAAICVFVLWRGGYCFVIDKSISPDRSTSVVVYDNQLSWRRFSQEDGLSLIITKKPNNIETLITYGDCTYEGLRWAPDGKKYVLSLKYGDRDSLALAWIEKSSESNLSAYLSTGVEMNELAKYGLQYNSDLSPEIKYQFLQWGTDSGSMLIYYSFFDVEQVQHDRYFWYNCEKGTVSATLELNP